MERGARAQLEAEAVRVERVAAYPTLLQLPLRRVVARGEGGAVRVGWTSALEPRPISWEVFVEADGPLVDAARASPDARLFEWFAMGEVAARLVPSPGGAAVELDDLRYGVPGRPRDGLWGLRVQLDARGRVQGDERIARPLPRGGALLRELWRRTVGTG